MVRIGFVGMGKMGLSHLSILNTHPDSKVVGICDAAGYVLDVINKYTGIATFADFRDLIEKAKPDAVVVATPSRTHAEIVRYALERGMHAFVEKPFCLSPEEGRALVELAERRGVVNQVGYHYRFVGAFQEMKRLLERRVVGEIHNFRIEAYGPVVLQEKGSTWRSRKSEGGGCLFDYASHAVNLGHYLFGVPKGVGGAVVHSIFSRDVDDEVYATLYYDGGLSGQLCINWSDETQRKMSVRVEAWGRKGRINGDRQECQVYLRADGIPELDLEQGWNARYTTELTAPVWYYVRGEEYSAQLDYFVSCIREGRRENLNSFASALETDLMLDMIARDAAAGPRISVEVSTGGQARPSGLRERIGKLFR